MRIVVVADDYVRDRHPAELQDIASAGGIDVVCCLGDLYSGVFKDLDELFPDAIKLAVFGNHDTMFHPTHAKKHGFKLIHQKTVSVGGWLFGGFDGAMRYKIGHYLWTEDQAAQKLKSAPCVDVLLSHSHPYHLTPPHANQAHIGFKALDDYLDRCRPKYLFCGHLHLRDTRQIGNTYVRVFFGIEVIEI